MSKIIVMRLDTSNYKIWYYVRKGAPVEEVVIVVADEFIDFLKKSKPHKETYEKMALDAMACNNFDQNQIDFARGNGFCKWEDGLLNHMTFSSSFAVDLVLEQRSDECNIYKSHNIFNVGWMSVFMTAITNYLSSMSMSFDRDNSTKSNYNFWYYVKNRVPKQNISVEISEDYLESMKGLDLNIEKYDQLAIDAMGVYGVHQNFIEIAEHEGVCHFDGGLLTKILLPFGDATGLILRSGTPQGDVYESHNLDNVIQSSVIMNVITNYLSDVEDTLYFKNKV